MSLNSFHWDCPFTQRTICHCKEYRHERRVQQYEESSKLVYQLYVKNNPQYRDLLRNLQQTTKNTIENETPKLSHILEVDSDMYEHALQNKDQLDFSENSEMQIHDSTTNGMLENKTNGNINMAKFVQSASNGVTCDTSNLTIFNPLTALRAQQTPQQTLIENRGTRLVFPQPHQIMNEMSISLSDSAGNISLQQIHNNNSSLDTTKSAIDSQQFKVQKEAQQPATPQPPREGTGHVIVVRSNNKLYYYYDNQEELPSYILTGFEQGGFRKRGRPPKTIQCGICKGETNVKDFIQCRRCFYTVHVNCHTPHLAHLKFVHRVYWTCGDCKLCEICKKEGDEDKLLICEQCDRAYHTFCVGMQDSPQEQEIFVCVNCKENRWPATVPDDELRKFVKELKVYARKRTKLR